MLVTKDKYPISLIWNIFNFLHNSLCKPNLIMKMCFQFKQLVVACTYRKWVCILNTAHIYAHAYKHAHTQHPQLSTSHLKAVCLIIISFLENFLIKSWISTSSFLWTFAKKWTCLNKRLTFCFWWLCESHIHKTPKFWKWGILF
jgi:hypothetical protein